MPHSVAVCKVSKGYVKYGKPRCAQWGDFPCWYCIHCVFPAAQSQAAAPLRNSAGVLCQGGQGHPRAGLCEALSAPCVPRLPLAHGAGDVPAVPAPVPARHLRRQSGAAARLHPTAPVAAPAVTQVSAASCSAPQLLGLLHPSSLRQCQPSALTCADQQEPARVKLSSTGNTSSLRALFPWALQSLSPQIQVVAINFCKVVKFQNLLSHYLL